MRRLLLKPSARAFAQVLVPTVLVLTCGSPLSCSLSTIDKFRAYAHQ